MHYTPNLKENVSLNAPIVNVVFCRRVPSELCPHAEPTAVQLAQMCGHLLYWLLGWCQHREDGKGLGEHGSVFGSEAICSSEFPVSKESDIKQKKRAS